MDYENRQKRQTPRCLECGTSISYGRKDKKFCCEECKNRHHNALARMSRTAKKKVMSILERNYDILDMLVREDVKAVWLSDLIEQGFNPGYSTFYRKTGRKDRYHCFDISYFMTPNRVSCITKIQNLSLTLPPVHDECPSGCSDGPADVDDDSGMTETNK